MLELHAGAFAHTASLPGIAPVCHGIDASWSKDTPTAPPSHPTTSFKLAALEKRLVEAYDAVSKNKLPEALAAFVSILLSVPLLTVETRKEVDEVKELVTICREYHTGIRCELEHRAVRPSCVVCNGAYNGVYVYISIS
jgi:coatomer protein complex subunit alpha (xenin)